MMLFFLYTLTASNEMHHLEIDLVQNETKTIELNQTLLVFINSYGFSADDFTFRHYYSDIVAEYNASNHRSFRNGHLEIKSQKNVTFKVWFLPASYCPANNYVITPSSMTYIQALFKNTPNFCFFSDLSVSYNGFSYETDFRFSSQIFLLNSNKSNIIQKEITYTIAEPFLFLGESKDSILGDVKIQYISSKSKCTIEPIVEFDQNWPLIDISCSPISKSFSLLGCLIYSVLIYYILFSICYHYKCFNFKRFWSPTQDNAAQYPTLADRTEADNIELSGSDDFDMYDA